MGLSVGFTGTRAGMTMAQASVVALLVKELAPTSVHHGDCVGADAEFDRICEGLGITDIQVHPPDKNDFRAHTRAAQWPERPYLERNRDIVGMCHVLIATPQGMTEQKRRSGTWHTVRYARDREIPRIIVFPDGTMAGKGEVNGRPLRDLARALQG